MSETDTDIIKDAKDAYKEAESYWQDNFDKALEDLRFENGEQWDTKIEKDRIAAGRPILTLNKQPAFVDQVIGDLRQNTPCIKIKPVDDKSDPETARVYQGLIKNIEVQSKADVVYDTAGESAVACGFGAFRIVNQYVDDESFDQEIRIKRIKNPFTVLFGKADEFDYRDSNDCFITAMMKKTEFERKYPDASAQNWTATRDDAGWYKGDEIRIAEWFHKEWTTKKIILVKDQTGKISIISSKDLVPGFHEVLKEREVDTFKLIWRKLTGTEILEEQKDWPGKFIPVVPILGKEIHIENDTHYRGVLRFGKDAQRLYNYARSAHAEIISLAPKSPFIAAWKQIAGHLKFWENAHTTAYPFLPYDSDPSNPYPPKRADPVMSQPGLMNEIQISDQEMHDTTGIQQASMGQQSNEKSGRAIIARQREGDVGAFAFYDNIGRAVGLAGEIILDMAPRIYDTARVVRILGEDNEEEFVKINQLFKDSKTGEQKKIDFSIGKYDVIVSVGPSYTTKRDEAAESMMQFIQAVPNAGAIAGDLIAGAMDWPGADKIAKRLKAMIPPQIIAAAEAPDNAPPPPPPEPPPPPPPDPKTMAQAHKTEAEAHGLDLQNVATKVQMAQVGIPVE